MVTKKPVRKSAMKNVTSKKMLAKKRPTAKASTIRKPAVKSKSYKKAPAKRIVEKKIETFKPFGIFVVVIGVLALFLLFVYALPVFTNSNNGDEPVLGAYAGHSNNPGQINYAKWDNYKIKFESSHRQDYYWVYCTNKYNGKITVDEKLINKYNSSDEQRYSTKQYKKWYNICYVWGIREGSSNGKRQYYDTNHERVR